MTITLSQFSLNQVNCSFSFSYLEVIVETYVDSVQQLFTH